jgi:hypothetical protein
MNGLSAQAEWMRLELIAERSDCPLIAIMVKEAAVNWIKTRIGIVLVARRRLRRFLLAQDSSPCQTGSVLPVRVTIVVASGFFILVVCGQPGSSDITSDVA